MIVVKPFDRKTTEEELRQFEFLIKAPLPSDYRDFLLRSNGGKPEPHEIYIDDELGGAIVRGFFGIDADEHYAFERYLEVYKGRVPRGFLPIANDAFGNLFCVSLNDDDRGAVYFWDHDFEADSGDPPTFENIHFVARNFGELLDKMQPPAPPSQKTAAVADDMWISPELQKIIDAQNATKKR